MRLCECIKRELDKFEKECNFTETELILFKLRAHGLSIEQCAEKMNMSPSNIKRLGKKIKAKMSRV